MALNSTRSFYLPQETAARRCVLTMSCISFLSMGTMVFAQDSAREGTLQLDDYWQLEEAEDAQISPDGDRIIYTRRYIDKLNDKWDGDLWIMGADGSNHRFFAEGRHVQWSPNSDEVAYIADVEEGGSQIFVRGMTADDAATQITRLSNQPPKDLWWSPNGEHIAFRTFVPGKARRDIGMPSPPEGANWTAEPLVTDRLTYKQDRVGYLPEGFAHLFVVAPHTGKARQVTHGDWNVGAGSAAGIDWTPDGTHIVFDGEMDDVDLLYLQSSINIVNLDSGETRNLTPGRAFWHSPVVSPDGTMIAYTGRSKLDVAWLPDELWVMNLDGTGKKQITRGSPDSPTDIRWSRNGRNLYFEYRAQGTQNLYRAALNGEVSQVTRGIHVLNVTSVSNDGRAAGIATSPVRPREVVTFELNSTDGIQYITNLNTDLLADVTLSEYEEIWYDSSDEARIQAWVVKPPQFDPSQKYPLILFIHGGPHGMYDVRFHYDWQNYAANGYVVLFSNPRGSTGYGGDFGNAIQNAYPGRIDFDDLTGAVDSIETRGYIDTKREYVTGCSAGGVLSTWLIGHTHRFAAAAPLCAAPEWIVVMGMSDAPAFVLSRFDTPWWEDPTQWLEHAPLMHVGKVQTPTMLVTGAKDMRIPFGQAEAYYAALKLRGVPARLIAMKDEWHGVTSKPTNFMRLQLYTLDWWRRWSK